MEPTRSPRPTPEAAAAIVLLCLLIPALQETGGLIMFLGPWASSVVVLIVTIVRLAQGRRATGVAALGYLWVVLAVVVGAILALAGAGHRPGTP